MKHTLTVLLTLAMALCLCACGEKAPEPTPTPEATPVVTPTPEPTPTPEAQPDNDRKATAEGLIGQDVTALYEAIGYPVSSSYAPSCLGDGEDGELVYDGFTVYTFKSADGSGERIDVVL